MNRTSPQISVIIPTYNRDTVLCETIDSVLKQDFSDFEIIVVDQTKKHSPEASNFLEQKNKSGEIRLIHQAKPSLTLARNTGFIESRGSIVIYIDDDVLLEPWFLEKYLKRFQDDRLAGLTGRIVFPGEDPKSPPPLGVSSAQAANRLDLQVMRFGSTIWNPAHIVGANMGFRRAWIQAAGGFHRFFAGSALGEDIEFATRIRRLGGSILYDPDIYLIHRVSTTGGCRTSGANAFSYQRERMRNYYFALMHRSNFREKRIWIYRRWVRSGNPTKTPSKEEKREQKSPTSIIYDRIGRTIGASEGTIAAFTTTRDKHLLNSQKPVRFPQKKLSVVVATYNRAEKLNSLLDKLCQMSMLINEVIIVDQSRQKSLTDRPRKLNVIYKRTKTPNASRARNIGVFLASSEVILFLDDDAIPSKNLIENHLEIHSNRSIACVGGRIVWPEYNPEAKAPYKPNSDLPIDHFDAPVCYYTTPAENVLHLITCNMSIKRDWFLIAGGFNERMPGGGEDIEFVARLSKLGGRNIYEPDAWVYHDAAIAGGTRTDKGNAFAWGKRRAFSRHYALLRSIGVFGWASASVNRIKNQYRRIVKIQKREETQIHLRRPANKPGGEKEHIFSRLLILCGMTTGVALSWWYFLMDRRVGGHYFRTLEKQSLRKRGVSKTV